MPEDLSIAQEGARPGFDLARLETETRNPNTSELDRLSTPDLVAALHRENYVVADAVAAVLPQLARTVDLVAERLGRGGRLFYVGAGTSGRLGRAGCKRVSADVWRRTRSGAGDDCRGPSGAYNLDRGSRRQPGDGAAGSARARRRSARCRGGHRGQRAYALCHRRSGRGPCCRRSNRSRRQCLRLCTVAPCRHHPGRRHRAGGADRLDRA